MPRKQKQSQPKIENGMHHDDEESTLNEDEAHALLLELKKEEATLKQLIHEFINELGKTKLQEQYIRSAIQDCQKKKNNSFNHNKNHNNNQIINGKKNKNHNHNNKDSENDDDDDDDIDMNGNNDQDIQKLDGDAILADLFKDVLANEFPDDDELDDEESGDDEESEDDDDDDNNNGVFSARIKDSPQS